MHDPTQRAPLVEPFFDPDTGTFTYVVYEHAGGAAAIIDPVLDFNLPSARTSTRSADAVLSFVARKSLRVAWILETHAHADHLSAAGYLKDKLGARVGIGRGIVGVQARFKSFFNLGDDFVPDGRQFDHLFEDGETFVIGRIAGHVIATPGHTEDSLTYVIGDAAFVGDTLFSPQAGTARTDFPGGDAATLYRSTRTLLSLPPETRIFLCHDYPADGRSASPQTTIQAQAEGNVHASKDVSEADFITRRRARDATLPPPRLLLPALQVNIRGGRLPDPDANGVRYLRIPLDQLGHAP